MRVLSAYHLRPPLKPPAEPTYSLGCTDTVAAAVRAAAAAVAAASACVAAWFAAAADV